MVPWTVRDGPRPMTLLRNIRTRLFQRTMAPAERRLATLKASQKDEFIALSRKHSADYASWRRISIDQHTTPLWRDFVSKLEPAVAPAPPFDFLRNPLVQRTMFVSGRNKWLGTELNLLEDLFGPKRLQSLLIEDYAGDPPLSNEKYLTSHNSVHHLYHLARYAYRTGNDLGKVRFVVEWGGGYGNLAKMFRRLVGDDLTYVIIDLPLFSLLQWTYLATVLGEEKVHLVASADSAVQTGKVNILPVCFVDRLDLACEMFVSTWALSESSPFSQDFVLSRKWFGAKHVLLAYQESDELLPDAGRVEGIANEQGMAVEDIEFLPGNRYAFL